MATKSTSNAGVVLIGDDRVIETRARRSGLRLVHGNYGPPPFGRTLFVQAGTLVPWDLLPAAWHFLERWDAAVPLWRYGVTAEDVGSTAERKRTRAITLDLRVLLYAHELLFVRDNESGRALIQTFADELEDGDEPRLAFLRAVYRVKPRLCVLPRTWLADVREYSEMAGRRGRGRPRGEPLVRVEIAPGRFVQCHKGDEQKVLDMFARRGRRG